MKNKTVLALIIFIALLIMPPVVYAARSENLTLYVGDTRTIYANSTEGTVVSYGWYSNNPQAVNIIGAVNGSQTTIRVESYSSSQVIVRCDMYVQKLIGTRIVQMSDFKDYIITIKESAATSVPTNVPDTPTRTPTPSSSSGVIEGVYWSVYGNTLRISGTGVYGVDDYDNISQIPWYKYRNSVTKVVIEDGVTEIGGQNFRDFTKLNTVEIADSVTRIGWSAFGDCTGLTSIRLPSGVTYIGPYAFGNCTNLANITIPSGVTEITDMLFTGCKSLTNITIPSGVTYIGKNAFYNCIHLTSISIPSSVTHIGDNAFRSCSRLKNFTIPSGMTKIGKSAFSGCIGLTSITIPSGVRSIEDYTFYGCSNLTNVTLQSGLTSIGQSVFQQCDNLTKINIPASVASINDYAFSYCKNLKNVTLPPALLSIGDSVFKNCSSLTTLSIPSYVTSIGITAIPTTVKIQAVEGSYAASWASENGYTVSLIGQPPISGEQNGISWSLVKDTLTISGSGVLNISDNNLYDLPWYNYKHVIMKVIIENGVTEIGAQFFRYFSQLKTIQIANSVTAIGDYALYGCTGLTNLTLPPSLISIGNYALYGCTGLTNLTLPPDLISFGDYAFAGCTRLTNVTISSGVTTIGDSAFRNCTGLTNVMISDGVLSIGDRAFSNTSLTSVTIPDSVVSIVTSAFNSNKVRIYASPDSYAAEWAALNSYALNDSQVMCTYSNGTLTVSGTGPVTRTCWTSLSNSSDIQKNAHTIIIQEGVTGMGLSVNDKNQTVGAFSKMDNLSSVILPDSIIAIGDSSFDSCYKLKIINLPDGLKRIGPSAFLSTSLTSLIFPEHLEYISNYAFKNTKLTEITLLNGLRSIGYEAFCNTPLTGVTIPESVSGIGTNAFDRTVLIYAVPGSYAVYWAAQNGYTLIDPNVTCTYSNGTLTVSGNGMVYRSCWSNLSNSSDIQKNTHTLIIKEGITGIGSFKKGAFAEMSGLSSATLPDSLISIDYDSFRECNNLKSIKIPKGVESIGNSAFYKTSLTSVILSDRLEWIGMNAFKYSGLENVTIPASVSFIDGAVFDENVTITVTPGTYAAEWLEEWSAYYKKGDQNLSVYTLNPSTGVYENVVGKTITADANSGSIRLDVWENYTKIKTEWVCKTTKVAKVDADGLVTPLSAGTANLTAKVNGKTLSVKINFLAMVQPGSLKISGSSVAAVKKVINLSVVFDQAVQPKNKKVTWHSSDSTIASVSNGKVKGMREGTAVIKACSVENPQYCDEKKIEVLPVAGDSVVITDLSDGTLQIDAGTAGTDHEALTYQFRASVLPGDASQKVEWKSSAAKVALVDENGTVIALAPGKTTITATAADGSKKSGKIVLTVTSKVQPGVMNLHGPAVIAEKKTGKLTLTFDQIVQPKNKNVAWSSSDPTVADVKNGTVTGKSIGEATITAVSKENPAEKAEFKIKSIRKIYPRVLPGSHLHLRSRKFTRQTEKYTCG